MLRLTRDLDETCTDSKLKGQQPCATGVEEDDMDMDDSEELYDTFLDCERVLLSVVYDIAYSTSYQVPVLYLHFRDSTSSILRPDPALLERIVHRVSRSQVQSVGTIGGISMTVRRAECCTLPV